jgi:hypothetical protein
VQRVKVFFSSWSFPPRFESAGAGSSGDPFQESVRKEPMIILCAYMTTRMI